MRGYAYVSMSLNEFVDFVTNCNDLQTLNRIKQQLDSVMKFVETSYGHDGRPLPPAGHPLNLIDLGERRQTVTDRWITVAGNPAA